LAQLTASVVDGAGAAITLPTLAWSTSDPNVALVDGGGLVGGVAPGAAVVTVQASFSGGPVVTTDAPVEVTEALMITSSATLSSVQGVSYSHFLTASGGDSNYTWSVSVGALPDFLSLNPSTGELSGTTTIVGTTIFTITVVDGAGDSDSQEFTHETFGPLTITTTTLSDGDTNAAYSETLMASGGQAPITWSLDSGSLPTGLGLNGTTGAITGTPTVSGDYPFTVQAASSDGQTAQQALSISVFDPVFSDQFAGGWDCAISQICQDVYDFDLQDGSDVEVIVHTVTGASVPRLALFGPGIPLDGINLFTGTTNDRLCVGQDMTDTASVTVSGSGTYRLAVGRDWGLSAGVSGTYVVDVNTSLPVQPQGQTADDVTSQASGASCPDNNDPSLDSFNFSGSSPMDPGASATVSVTASDPDGDPLTYTWTTTGGTITGSGSSITWTAPTESNFYNVNIEITDGRGGSTSATISPAVRGFTLLVPTDDGIIAIDEFGATETFSTDFAFGLEVNGLNIYAGNPIQQYGPHGGSPFRTVPTPPEVTSWIQFATLPQTGGFALLDNVDDEVSIVDFSGNWVTTMAMPELSPGGNQNIYGVWDGTQLLVSETGTSKVAAFDLTNFLSSIHRDLSASFGSLSAIAADGSDVYLATHVDLMELPPGGGFTPIHTTILGGNIVGIAVHGGYIYSAVNFEGHILRTEIATGNTVVFATGLNRPGDLAFYPVDLVGN
jgi:hypothetical protein